MAAPAPAQEEKEEEVVKKSGLVFWLWGQTSSDKISTREAMGIKLSK